MFATLSSLLRKPLLDEKGKIIRRYYEISTLWELRSALRSGDIWVKNSRRYAKKETYLIEKGQWPDLRPEALRLLNLPEKGSALTLVTNAVIVWNTRYIHAIIDQLRAEGYTVNESDLIHISPCRLDHINKYGKYFFNVDRELNRKQLRPLRNTKD